MPMSKIMIGILIDHHHKTMDLRNLKANFLFKSNLQDRLLLLVLYFGLLLFYFVFVNNVA
jgi:hypothetical protein